MIIQPSLEEDKTILVSMSKERNIEQGREFISSVVGGPSSLADPSWKYFRLAFML